MEERTLQFAKRVIALVNRMPKTLPSIEIGRQLVKSSGSVGANCTEANESLSRKDFFMRIKICRKESKESRYWLKLIQVKREDKEERGALILEATELMKIFGSIVRKVQIGLDRLRL